MNIYSFQRFAILNPTIDFKSLDNNNAIENLILNNDDSYSKVQSAKTKRNKGGKKKKKPENTQQKRPVYETRVDWDIFSRDFK